MAGKTKVVLFKKPLPHAGDRGKFLSIKFFMAHQSSSSWHINQVLHVSHQGTSFFLLHVPTKEDLANRARDCDSDGKKLFRLVDGGWIFLDEGVN